MAIQLINNGTVPNDGTGDSLHAAATKINENFTELYDAVGMIPDAYTDEQVRDVIGAALVEGAGIDLTVNDGGDTITIASTISALAMAASWTPNFTAAADALIYADVAMTVTQQSTSGTGTVAYAKSTAAAPSTFTGTTSPITLEAGAWLKVTASSVTAPYAVHLKRTA